MGFVRSCEAPLNWIRTHPGPSVRCRTSRNTGWCATLGLGRETRATARTPASLGRCSCCSAARPGRSAPARTTPAAIIRLAIARLAVSVGRAPRCVRWQPAAPLDCVLVSVGAQPALLMIENEGADAARGHRLQGIRNSRAASVSACAAPRQRIFSEGRSWRLAACPSGDRRGCRRRSSVRPGGRRWR